MLKKLYLLHHSHTDIGFTHPQPMLRYLQQRFLDEAIALTEETADFPREAQTKWTCETLIPVLDWLKSAKDREVERFLALERRGLIEVTGSYAIMTQCAPPRAWEFMFEKVEELRRRFGLTIRSAMMSDINGAPWMLPDFLEAHGIGNFSMAINEHFGKSSLPRSYPFRWKGPQGGSVRAWNGFHYNSNQYFGIPYDVELASREITQLATWLQRQNNTLSFTSFQVTRPDFVDNGGVDARLPGFVRDWNDRGLLPALEIVTLSGFFDAVGTEIFDQAPEHAGEWTDFWNFGTASTPHETRLNRRTYRTLRDVEALAATLPETAGEDIAQMVSTSIENAILYDEHTWGADTAVSDSFCDASRTELHYKQNFAQEADTYSKMARAEVLSRVAASIPVSSKGNHMLIVNTLPWRRTETIEIPVHWLRRNVVPTRSHQHRMQLIPIGWPAETVPIPTDPLPTEYAQAEALRIEVELDAYSHVCLPAAELYRRGTPVVPNTSPSPEGILSNPHFTVTLSPHGGISSIVQKSNGREWISSSPLVPVGLPLRESPTMGHRNAIHQPPDYTRFMGFKGFSTDWQADRVSCQTTAHCTISGTAGRTTLRQELCSPFVNAAFLEITLDDASPRIEVLVGIDFRWDERPCAWYLPLEFALETPVFDYDNCGATVRLGRDQVPDANMDFQTVDRWVKISDSIDSVLIAPLDTPIVSLGGFSFGRMTTAGSARRPMIAAWLHSNYWDTNYAASCLGKTSFRFVIEPVSGPVDTKTANRFSDAVTHPFLLQPVSW